MQSQPTVPHPGSFVLEILLILVTDHLVPRASSLPHFKFPPLFQIHQESVSLHQAPTLNSRKSPAYVLSLPQLPRCVAPGMLCHFQIL